MIILEPSCIDYCKHYNGRKLGIKGYDYFCDAFPSGAGIPFRLWEDDGKDRTECANRYGFEPMEEEYGER